MKRITRFYFVLISVLSFSFNVFSQEKILQIDRHISHLDSLKDTTGVYFRLDPKQTLSNYYRSSYLYFQSELEYQTQLLAQATVLFTPPSNPSPGDLETFVEQYVASKARAETKLLEINEVSKAAKIESPPLISGLQLSPEWQLRDWHQSLLYNFALNEGLKENPLIAELAQEKLGEIEFELKRRGLFQAAPEQAEILRQRFEKVEELNRIALEEAYHFIDQSSVFIDDRQRLATLQQEIGDIDQSLGVEKAKIATVRNLLKQDIVEQRVMILDFGLKELEKKNFISRNYDSDIEIFIPIAEEQLSQDKMWLYQQKNHQVIGNGLKNKGPPGDLSPDDFFEIPYPKKPSGGGNGGYTLDEFLNDDQQNTLDKRCEKAFERTVSKYREKYKTINFNSPNWENARQTRFYSDEKINSNELSKSLTVQAKRYFDFLPVDPIEAATAKATFEATVKYLEPDAAKPIEPIDVLANDPKKLKEIQVKLKSAIESHDKKIAEKGILAEPWMQLRRNDLNQAQQETQQALNKASIKDLYGKGAHTTRPPPEFEEWISRYQESSIELNTEKYQLTVLESQKKALQLTQAKYGQNAPPSLGMRMSQIEQTLNLNSASNALQDYNSYAKDVPIFQFLDLLINDLKLTPDDPKVQEIKQKISVPELEQIKNDGLEIFTKLDATQAWLKANPYQLKASRLALLDEVHNALLNLEGQKKVGTATLTTERYRPSQAAKKVKEMSNLKEPGGIWLSPKGIPVKASTPVNTKWIYLQKAESCTSDYVTWNLNLKQGDKICFPNNTSHSSNIPHWAKNIRPW